jgi:hemerythrin-like metal-binding protein
MAVEWKNEYATGIREIDEQHREYLDMVNTINVAAKEKHDHEKIAVLVDEIFVHMAKHFSTEEEYFDKFNYYHSKDHKRDHRKLLAESLNFKYRFQEEGTKVIPEFMNFLEEWMLKHMNVYDKKYKGHIR